MKITHVKMTPNGFVHVAKNGKTACGRDYRRYDYIPYYEDEKIDLVHNALCHKCTGRRRTGPRTIAEAMRIGYEPRRTGGSDAR